MLNTLKEKVNLLKIKLYYINLKNYFKEAALLKASVMLPTK